MVSSFFCLETLYNDVLEDYARQLNLFKTQIVILLFILIILTQYKFKMANKFKSQKTQCRNNNSFDMKIVSDLTYH